jgi:endonuclease/exonuclease/phosphatase family metal-dependent hydrolase
MTPVFIQMMSSEKKTVLQAMTYNVQREWHRDAILRDIKALRNKGLSPDILMFQEAKLVKGGHSKLIEGIRKALVHPLEFLAAPYDHSFLGIHEALITAWNPDTLELSDDSQNVTSIPSLEKNPWIERIKNGNLSPVQRIAQVLRFKVKGVLQEISDETSLCELHTGNVHLDCYGSEVHKATQLREVLRQLIKTDGQTTLLAGDFNTNSLFPGNAYDRYSLIRELLDKVKLKRLEDVKKTMHIGTPYAAPRETFACIQRFMARIKLHYAQKLDFIFGSNAEAVSAEVLPVGGSDHFPLVSNFRLRLDNPDERVVALPEDEDSR